MHWCSSANAVEATTPFLANAPLVHPFATIYYNPWVSVPYIEGGYFFTDTTWRHPRAVLYWFSSIFDYFLCVFDSLSAFFLDFCHQLSFFDSESMNL